MTQRLPDAEDRWRSDQDSSSQDGAPGCGSPPAYDSLERATSAATPTPQKPTSGPEGNGTGPVQPGPLYTWSNCEVGQGWGALVLEMAPNPGHRSGYWGLSWAAGLGVKCRDMPRLMREGFFWSADNILPEEGYMAYSPLPGWPHMGFDYQRVWSLADKSNGETPLWVAQLEVRSHSVAVLSGFQVHSLSRENVDRADAWNAEEQQVYHFDHYSPSHCFNCIYNDMPLQGWWPWPRSMEGRTQHQKDASGPGVEQEDAGDGLASQHEFPRPHRETSGCVIL